MFFYKGAGGIFVNWTILNESIIPYFGVLGFHGIQNKRTRGRLGKPIFELCCLHIGIAFMLVGEYTWHTISTKSLTIKSGTNRQFAIMNTTEFCNFSNFLINMREPISTRQIHGTDCDAHRLWWVRRVDNRSPNFSIHTIAASGQIQ